MYMDSQTRAWCTPVFFSYSFVSHASMACSSEKAALNSAMACMTAAKRCSRVPVARRHMMLCKVSKASQKRCLSTSLLRSCSSQALVAC